MLGERMQRFVALGLPPPPANPQDKRATICDPILDALERGAVVARPGIERFEGKEVVSATARASAPTSSCARPATTCATRTCPPTSSTRATTTSRSSSAPAPAPPRPVRRRRLAADRRASGRSPRCRRSSPPRCSRGAMRCRARPRSTAARSRSCAAARSTRRCTASRCARSSPAARGAQRGMAGYALRPDPPYESMSTPTPPHMLPLEERLILESAGEDRFRALLPGFGAVTLGCATLAAARTTELALHSLHAYFLRPTPADRPALLRVARVRDGRRFATRRVEVLDGDKLCCELLASFAAAGSGPEYEEPAPRPDAARARGPPRRDAGDGGGGPGPDAARLPRRSDRDAVRRRLPLAPERRLAVPRVGAPAKAAAGGAGVPRRRDRVPRRPALARAGGAPPRIPLRAVRLHEPGSGRVDAPDRAVDRLAAAHVGLGHRPGRPRVRAPHAARARRTPDRDRWRRSSSCRSRRPNAIR